MFWKFGDRRQREKLETASVESVEPCQECVPANEAYYGILSRGLNLALFLKVLHFEFFKRQNVGAMSPALPRSYGRSFLREWDMAYSLLSLEWPFSSWSANESNNTIRLRYSNKDVHVDTSSNGSIAIRVISFSVFCIFEWQEWNSNLTYVSEKLHSFMGFLTTTHTGWYAAAGLISCVYWAIVLVYGFDARCDVSFSTIVSM